MPLEPSPIFDDVLLLVSYRCLIIALFFKYHPHELLKREKREKKCPSLARTGMVMPIVGPGHAGAVVSCYFVFCEKLFFGSQ